jgi:dTDP-4-dehydrorhamnose reductase
MLIEVAQKRIVGILHLAGSQRISRYALGMRIAEILNVPKELLLPRKIAEVKSVPPRARDVSLDISKARALLATPFLALDDGLARELKRRL